MRLSGFFDVMCRYNDRLVAVFGDLNQMIPYTIKNKKSKRHFLIMFNIFYATFVNEKSIHKYFMRQLYDI